MKAKMLRPDSKGRITLGLIAKGISAFLVHEQRDGSVILEPFVEIPMKEKWLFDNKKALHQVQTGLQQAKNNELVSKGSFAEFIDDAQE